MSDVSKHTFNKGVDTILKECLAISDQRGAEYEDSWGLENVYTPVINHVLRMKGTFDSEDEMLDRRWRRLLAMGGMIDVKLSRLLGPHKDDTYIDLINYSACFAYLMREWYETIKSRPNGQITAASVPTFNDDINADLHQPEPYVHHWHLNAELVIPDNNTSWSRAQQHRIDGHRQDGSPIYAHRDLHEGSLEPASLAWLDSEYGPA